MNATAIITQPAPETKNLYECNRYHASALMHRQGYGSAEYRTQWQSGAVLFEGKDGVFYTVKTTGEIVKH